MAELPDESPAMSVLIRPARADEALTLARVHTASWQTAYRGILPDSYLDALDVNRRAEMWQERLTYPDAHTCTLVAETGDGVVTGFASGGPARALIALPGSSGDAAETFDGELYAIYLLAEHRRQGTGRRLAAAVAHELAAFGFRSLLVWVLAANPARAFYETLGAVRVGETDITIADLVLPELAYGWPDVRVLMDSCNE